MKALRQIVNTFGYGGQSFEYVWNFYDIEIFFTLWEEFSTPMLLSFCAVLVVILIITSDITATLIVTLCVVMTDIFLAGIMFYWDIALNPVAIL